MAEIIVSSAPLESPLGEHRLAIADPAKRPRTLRGKRLLLLDNSQVVPESRNYGDLFGRLEQDLYKNYEVDDVIRFTCNLLEGDQEHVRRLVPEVKSTGADAVIVALCHAGVTQPSTMLAVELEKANIPTALICTSLGFGLAVVTASAYLTGLPLALVKPTRGLPEETVARDTEELLQTLVEGLTGTTEDIGKRFRALIKDQAGTIEGEALGPLSVSIPTPTGFKSTSSRGRELEIDPSLLDEPLYEACCARHLCDGLPIIAPTRERVEAALQFTDNDPHDVLLRDCPPGGAEMTVQKVAVNAVMAGCRPEYFPIVLAATKAMTQSPYRLFQASITTHPSGNMVLVSGPLAEEIGMNSGAGCLGPGFRANATIGRALTLIMLNICRSIPGFSDLSTFGSPAEYTYCFAESQDTPWTPFHEELFDRTTTSVTVHKCEAPRNSIDNLGKEPEQILTAIASVAATLGGNNATVPSELVVILNPSQAKGLADNGWSKEDVRQFLYDQARNSAEALRSSTRQAIHWPKWFFHVPDVPVVHSPNDIILVVAGGVGPHSMVAVPWGFARAVTVPVLFDDGKSVESVYDFRRRA